jgi:hypothetical protein
VPRVSLAVPPSAVVSPNASSNSNFNLNRSSAALGDASSVCGGGGGAAAAVAAAAAAAAVARRGRGVMDVNHGGDNVLQRWQWQRCIRHFKAGRSCCKNC